MIPGLNFLFLLIYSSPFVYRACNGSMRYHIYIKILLYSHAFNLISIHTFTDPLSLKLKYKKTYVSLTDRRVAAEKRNHINL